VGNKNLFIFNLFILFIRLYSSKAEDLGPTACLTEEHKYLKKIKEEKKNPYR